MATDERLSGKAKGNLARTLFSLSYLAKRGGTGNGFGREETRLGLDGL